MQWTNALGQLYQGSSYGGVRGIIPYQTTDTTGGAFPGGSLRWGNLGSDNGVEFDLIATVTSSPAAYADTVAVEYVSPQSSGATQALFTTAGYACLGFGLRPSLCASGSTLDVITARCSDGTPTTTRAAEFDFRFVEAGTTTSMPPFSAMYTTFYDVDGDVVDGGSVYEYVSVLGASVSSIAYTSTLVGGTFSPSGALYAEASQNVNVQTDFFADTATPPAVSLPAIAAFEVLGRSAFKVLLGGRSSAPSQNDRGYCFSMVRPELGLACPPAAPPPPHPPTSPSPSFPSGICALDFVHVAREDESDPERFVFEPDGSLVSACSRTFPVGVPLTSSTRCCGPQCKLPSPSPARMW